jgi:aryl-alcohol dehydrogenase-like predicted oxidoreductase
MRYRQLGRWGMRVSELSLGTWLTLGERMSEDTALECLAAAREAGVNFIDTAETYADGRAEAELGRLVKRLDWRREDLVLSTKIFWGGTGPNDTGLSHKHLIEGVNQSLRRLGTDYVDLLFCHRPDPHTPIEETVRALDVLVKQGAGAHRPAARQQAPARGGLSPTAKIRRACPLTGSRPQV